MRMNGRFKFKLIYTIIIYLRYKTYYENTLLCYN